MLPADQDVAVETLEVLDLVLDTVWIITVTLVVNGQAKVLGERSDSVVWALAGAVYQVLSEYSVKTFNGTVTYPSCSLGS